MSTATSSMSLDQQRSSTRFGAWGALPVLLAGTFMIVLDFFIVNVALPSMQADLQASTGVLEWVIAGYGLTFATCLISAGRLGGPDRPAPCTVDRPGGVHGNLLGLRSGA